MIEVEGLEIHAECIPKQQLIEAWKKLSDNPFPKIKMFQLSDGDFNHVLQHRRCLEDDLGEIREWGRVLPIESTDACVFNDEEDSTDCTDYIILVRQNPYHSLEEIILHELGHIARGDL
ncbi:MAG: hypothetical protein LBH74_10115 [Nitrososphaerota archaeon]|jgi:hypothetical protein|uniref:hypothetical protein n=1 Tax=Candidatus Bathycorpusculum sp. TaxID=2994959 RepID=UPI002839280B|nr:hypothetical protein [Candidatus Termitimicrobium sp.]MCL2431410.1 hypothetical protein [Candidatus Termitimicrobium sp.]MDR0493969.1 hypothetical protein [Nitrososphaerota archaeon]